VNLIKLKDEGILNVKDVENKTPICFLNMYQRVFKIVSENGLIMSDNGLINQEETKGDALKLQMQMQNLEVYDFDDANKLLSNQIKEL